MSAMAEFDIEVQQAVANACAETGGMTWWYEVQHYPEGHIDAVGVLCFARGDGATLAAVTYDGVVDTGREPHCDWRHVPGVLVADGQTVTVDGDELWWTLADVEWAIRPTTDHRGVVLLEADDPRATVCGECGRAWDDSVSTSVTPTPAGRCPFEDDHDDEEDA